MTTFTIMARRHQNTTSMLGRNASGRAFPPTEFRSSTDLPQFSVITSLPSEAIYFAGWILNTRRDPTTTHTYTITDGNGNIWDETGRKL